MCSKHPTLNRRNIKFYEAKYLFLFYMAYAPTVVYKPRFDDVS